MSQKSVMQFILEGLHDSRMNEGVKKDGKEIKCPKCNSTDVIVREDGSYYCKECDLVFTDKDLRVNEKMQRMDSYEVKRGGVTYVRVCGEGPVLIKESQDVFRYYKDCLDYALSDKANMKKVISNIKRDKNLNTAEKEELLSRIGYTLEGTHEKSSCNGRKLYESSDDSYEQFLRDCQSNATYKKAVSIAKKYGYTVAPLCYVETYGRKKVVNFSFIYDRSEYRPEIRYSSKSGRFEIQTTAYGSLSIEEHDKFVEAVVNANKMVKKLSKLDLTTLYEAPPEE